MSLPLEEITLRARAIGASFGTSSKGNPQLAIQCEVVDHDQYTGEAIAAILNFTVKSQTRSIESLQHFGFPSDDLSLLEDVGPEKCAELLPDTVELVCAPEEYPEGSGEWNLKVKWVNKPGRGRFAFKEPLKGAGLKAFAAQMRGMIRNARGGARPTNGGGGAKPAQPKHPNAPGADIDDIPFASCDVAHEPNPIARVLR